MVNRSVYILLVNLYALPIYYEKIKKEIKGMFLRVFIKGGEIIYGKILGLEYGI